MIQPTSRLILGVEYNTTNNSGHENLTFCLVVEVSPLKVNISGCNHETADET